MIFTGDIAAPTEGHCNDLAELFRSHSGILGNKTLVCNFEGLMSEKELAANNSPVLSNHPFIAKVLTSRGPVVACLANNHILDLPENYGLTIQHFEEAGIHYSGAGRDRNKANAPVRLQENGKDVFIFNACWGFLLYHQTNPTAGIYIAEIHENDLIRSVATCRRENPNAAVIVYLHWSFDLETLPFPMYRQFAKALIDAGANIVAGSHSHCVQGGEKHKDGFIVYGLGNFFMPHGVFAGGKISYPEFASTELVLEWNFETNVAICHWFEYSEKKGKHVLKYNGSDAFEDSVKLRSFSPFTGMHHEQYIVYFKKYRRKKFLIPVYRDYRSVKINHIFTWLLKNRARIARFLAQNNLIRWQR